MGKFNKSKMSVNVADTTNAAGGVAYSREVKQELASVILNTMLNGDSYYQSEKDRLSVIEQMLSNEDYAEFAAKAMVYTRNVGNLRSISHYLGTVLSEKVKGSSYLRSALRQTFVRPDDLTETLACWNSRNEGKMVPNSLRRAMKDALETYDNYQLKKYEGSRSAVKLRDVVKLAHPKGDFKALIEGTLKPIQTAQTVNAAAKGEARAESYKSMLQNRKLGYMAALKNIKNILESGADEETVDMLCNLLRNEKACLNSRVLPFRFTQAFSIVTGMNIDRLLVKKVVKAIEDGFIISARNIPIVEEGEKVAILLDESGSMGGYYGDDTQKTPFMIGKTLMASMLSGLDKENTIGYLWADTAREVSVDGSPFDFIKNVRTQGGGTDVWAAISGLIESKTYVDKLVILTDMQMYSIGSWGYRSSNREFKDMVKEYRKINPNVKVLFWNLEGYGSGTPMKLNHDILEVSGFSDKMLSVIPKMWTDKNALVKEIEAIVL